MADFFTDLLDGFLNPSFLEKVRDKFHYEETQSRELQAVAEQMLPLMREEAFWESNISSLQKSSGTEYEDVVMSLGAGIDSLQDHYSSQGMLSRSYMLEVLASELLLQGYVSYNRYVEKNTDWHVARYHFLGSEDSFPLSMIPRLLDITDGRITCNEAYCMLPKKSVAFVAELTQDEKVRCEGVCVGCNRRQCPNRVAGNHPDQGIIARMADLPLTYGYGRIFGKI
ncbi:MAG: hypothetical protein HDR17_10390 [Lachnospiraceae bacterium]|nr:hypothetical protein [Lachnospiraceae bacterium]MBD5502251.1 hypothetical protein [Lachnospiraceae bacterium]